MRVKKESERAVLKFNIQKTKIITSSPITLWQIEGEKWKQWQTFFSWALKSLWAVTAAVKLKDAHWKESYDQPRQHIKKQRHYFGNKGLSSQGYGFSSTHVQMWELDHKEGWTLKNWCFWIVVLEKILVSPLDCREIKAVNPKGNQPWISIGKTDAEAKAPILWPPDGKVQLFGKDPDAGKDWRQRRRGTPEDEMVGWHHWLNGHEFEQTLGDSGAQKSLLCCSPWGLKELDST